jgi:hypothetical protein
MVLVFQVRKMSTMRRSTRSNDKEHEGEKEVEERILALVYLWEPLNEASGQAVLLGLQ